MLMKEAIAISLLVVAFALGPRQADAAAFLASPNDPSCPPKDMTEIVLGMLHEDAAEHVERVALARRAVAQINDPADGWWDDIDLSPFTLRLVANDSSCDPAKSPGMAYYQVACDHVDAIVGASCSGSSAAAHGVLKLFGIPQFSHAATSPTLANKDTFPLFGRT